MGTSAQGACRGPEGVCAGRRGRAVHRAWVRWFSVRTDQEHRPCRTVSFVDAVACPMVELAKTCGIQAGGCALARVNGKV